MLALRTDNLCLRYGAQQVLNGVSLEVAAGEVLALIGPSGSGKSTVLRCVAGLEVPSGGQVWLRGQEATRWPPERRGVGMVFQDYALFTHLNVVENVRYGLRWGFTRREGEQKALAALERVGLVGLERRRVTELSGGQQQRVALARALAPEPQLLLLDEPLSHLDEQLRAELRSELHRLFASLGCSVVLVTHDQREAAALAGQVALLRGGRVVQRGAAQAVFARPATAWAAQFLGERNVLSLPGGQARCVPEVALRLGEGQAYVVQVLGTTEQGVLVQVQHAWGPLEFQLSPREAQLVTGDTLRLSIDEARTFVVPDDRGTR